MVDLARRGILKGKPGRQTELPVRPPWHRNEDHFTETCDRCGECVKSCEEHIIIIGDGGFPEINFKHGECTFCRQCADSCSADALSFSEDRTPFNGTKLSISQSCLNEQGIICQSCCDSCDQRAIRPEWKNAIPDIRINQDLCNTCGACISVCPAQSITVLSAGDSL